MSGVDVYGEGLAAHWHDIVVGAAQVQRRVDALMDAAGVSTQYFGVLNRLLSAADYRLPMSVLARDLAMTSGGFTKLADRMAADGLIDRRGSSSDRRVVHARLTEHGVQAAERGRAVFDQALAQCVGAEVSEHDLGVAAAVLRSFAAAPTDALPEQEGHARGHKVAGSRTSRPTGEQLTAERGPGAPERRRERRGP